MLAYSGDRDLCQQELGKATFLRPGATEDQPCEPLEAGSHFLRQSRGASAKLFWPFAMHEIVPMIKEEEARLFEMLPHPGGCMQRGPQTVARTNRCTDPLLKIQHGSQPECAEQYVA